jgi:hypothetical protein
VKDNAPGICLTASISINGKIQKLEKVEGFVSPDIYQIKLEDPGGFAAKPDKPVVVTQAFQLRLITTTEEWIQLKDIGTPKSEFRCIDNPLGLEMDNMLELQPLFTKLTFAENDRHLDFMIRRNLEHILSVCSIPTPNKGTALTCGDISGHRLVTSASL